MDRDLTRNWMWSEACEMLARAERLNRELFRPAELGTAVIHRLEQVDQALAAALDGEK